MRIDNRLTDVMRPAEIVTGYLLTAEGSVLMKLGHTQVLCAATIEDSVPPFLRNSGKGWVTAEYSMLPRSTAKRTPREVVKGRPSGRTHEIQRLIGRSLRSVMDMAALGERTVMLDCDVLQADGGTRTASITGAFVALALALRRLVDFKVLKAMPVRDYVAATSVGLVGGAADAGSLLRRGFAGRRRYERRDDRRGQVHRGAGHRRAQAVRRCADGRIAGARPRRHCRSGRVAEARGATLIAGPAPLRLFCATGNPGKAREFALAAGERIMIQPLPDFRAIAPCVEDGATFAENAIIKARYYGARAPGLLFADDSGLEVDALGGAPGVYSARFSGPGATDESNNRLLLERLRGVEDRRARFVCAIAVVNDGQPVGIYTGSVDGVILDAPRSSHSPSAINFAGEPECRDRTN